MEAGTADGRKQIVSAQVGAAFLCKAQHSYQLWGQDDVIYSKRTWRCSDSVFAQYHETFLPIPRTLWMDTDRNLVGICKRLLLFSGTVRKSANAQLTSLDFTAVKVPTSILTSRCICIYFLPFAFLLDTPACALKTIAWHFGMKMQ